ncbi:MAG: hypothetical protein HPY67_09215 [Syntrophaceae bacterium]|nr:hypothetical protein [Syntrophaceae bacterium]
MRRINHVWILLAALAAVHLGAVTAGAALIMGGQDPLSQNPETRDGASGIIFVDLTSRVSADGTLTGWNIYAKQYYKLEPSQPDSSARNVQLVIFRQSGSDYIVVGMSPMETVSQWDRFYHFNLPGIAVQKNDIIGWYYPKIAQGDNYYPPGGVIGYSDGGNNTHWYWPAEGAVPPGIGGTLALSLFSDGGPRTYSINVEGNPVPIPGALWLLGSGLLGLVAFRRRFKK